ncbi:ABC transporter ATP-binding protein [Clostridium grantii]|uniref:Putative ABC transport system ATP-binding protein n=1 Tax=Clostridium grantii DSM 8605 TaxID=1121316 RepID=A0A1M5V7R8_9CLOT|nr:ABC transporter ATP-binding protein [Clostridium grantii]SHH71266.1 putative ABC transport system ATP-binding protein [Clostridium grantii DSM 8605]
MSLIETKNIVKNFKLGKVGVKILKGISLEVEKGEFVAIVGESGSGKSTLLNIIGGLMPPSSGEIEINGKKLIGLNENQLALFRRDNIGFIFQSYNLLPQLTALENVERPLIFSGIPKKTRKIMALNMIERVGLADRANHKPSELSGGQQQRVSIARALVNNPEIILADEPTGNLDSKTSTEILEILKELNVESKKTFVVVTHSKQVTEYADRVINMVDGFITSIDKNSI